MHIDASNFLFVSSEMQQLEVRQNETQLDVLRCHWTDISIWTKIWSARLEFFLPFYLTTWKTHQTAAASTNTNSKL